MNIKLKTIAEHWGTSVRHVRSIASDYEMHISDGLVSQSDAERIGWEIESELLVQFEALQSEVVGPNDVEFDEVPHE